MLDFTDADEAISDSGLSLTPRVARVERLVGQRGSIDDLDQPGGACVRVKPGDEKMVAAEPPGRAVTLSDDGGGSLDAPTPGLRGAAGRFGVSDRRAPGGRVRAPADDTGARLVAPGAAMKQVRRRGLRARLRADDFAECVGPIAAALDGASSRSSRTARQARARRTRWSAK